MERSDEAEDEGLEPTNLDNAEEENEEERNDLKICEGREGGSDVNGEGGDDNE